MARGGGGGGSHHVSSSGHSMSHSSGGHHVSRPSSSSSHLSSRSSVSHTSRPVSRSTPPRPMGGGYGTPPRPPKPPRPMGGGYGAPPPRPPRPIGGGYGAPPPARHVYVHDDRHSISHIAGVIFVFIVLMMITISVLFSNGSSVPASTQNRVKLESGNSFINDCVKVEGSVFEINEPKLETSLKEFYNKTGIQPYIIIKEYEPSLQTDKQKEDWTVEYYESNFTREDIFLYVYFQQEDELNADEAGYMTYAMGNQVDSVMDSEAIEIFWSYIDKYWYSNCTETELFEKAFNETATRIMDKSTTGADVMKYFVIFIIVFAGGVIVITLVNKKYKRDKEKAEEDARILNTSVNDIVQDDLTNKYL